MRNTYFILRHGESYFQTKYQDLILCGWPEKYYCPLTKKGKEKIEKVAQKLKKLNKIDLIYCSDFLRTKQTARIIAQKLKKRIIFDKKLREVNLGVYAGKRKEEFYGDFPHSREYPQSLIRFSKRPRQGESWNDVLKRIGSLVEEIEKRYKDKNILIISHGGPLWLLEGMLNGWSKEKILKKRIRKGVISAGELRKLN